MHSTNSTGHKLEIVDLTKFFQMNGSLLPVLANFTLEIEPGEFVVIIGASGCGKTTLLRIIAGLETADTIEVLLPWGESVSVGWVLNGGWFFRNPGSYPGSLSNKMLVSGWKCSSFPAT
jgi:energy-coupling factor transporter ATP-binding protein EcfA2